MVADHYVTERENIEFALEEGKKTAKFYSGPN